MRNLLLFLALLCPLATSAQTPITVTVPANVSQLIAMQAWCQWYMGYSTTPTSPQLETCVATLLQRAVQAYSVQTQSNAITPAPFNPN